jgi:PPK2 family polyphosphate:nucleotide phosphotransferase
MTATAHLVSPDSNVQLKHIPTRIESDITKEDGLARLNLLKTELDAIQEELYAAGQHSVLIVLQGMDTSGKDGTVRAVFGDVSPAGCRVEYFKVPSAEEAAHDFLWRVHNVTPRKGMMAIFNRSHYEDVLVVRVHDMVKQAVWKKRYRLINDFEHLLAENDTIILKFFLHISFDEQENRLLAREEDIQKAWKISPGDWEERKYWDDYQAAYEDALNQCSPKHAPWYIVPADQKWYRNLLIAETVVATLNTYRQGWQKTLELMNKTRLEALADYRAQQQT